MIMHLLGVLGSEYLNLDTGGKDFNQKVQVNDSILGWLKNHDMYVNNKGQKVYKVNQVEYVYLGIRFENIEKISEDIGFDIGNSDDVTQAKLLNGFCKAFDNLSKYDRSLQLSYIGNKLDENSKKLLKELTEFL